MKLGVPAACTTILIIFGAGATLFITFSGMSTIDQIHTIHQLSHIRPASRVNVPDRAPPTGERIGRTASAVKPRLGASRQIASQQLTVSSIGPSVMSHNASLSTPVLPTRTSDWVEEMIFGTGPYSNAVQQCLTANRRRQSSNKINHGTDFSSALDRSEVGKEEAEKLGAFLHLRTTWECKLAHGSQLGNRRQTCLFRNLLLRVRSQAISFYLGPCGSTYSAGGGGGGARPALPKRITVSAGHRGVYRDDVLSIIVQQHESLKSFLFATTGGKWNKSVVHRNLTLAFTSPWHFNIGHVIFDALYPAFVSLIQFGKQDEPFRAFVLSEWSRHPVVLRTMKGVSARHDEVVGSIGGLGVISATPLDAQDGAHERVLHRFDELVVGMGTDGHQIDMNANQSLGACRTLDACRAYRKHAFDALGLPQPLPAHSQGPFRVTLIANKRFKDDSLQDVTQALQKEPSLVGFSEIQWVNWTMVGTLTEHMKIIRQTHVHVSGGGTSHIYAIFLPDGADNTR